MALVEFSDNIQRLFDEENYVSGIFIDFIKAFDTVGHETLLYKLYRYDILAPANKFFWILPNTQNPIYICKW